MEVMVSSFDEPEPWELQKMASLGLVRDERLLSWAEKKGLPRDGRLFENMAFYGCDLDGVEITVSLVKAAAAGGSSPDIVMDLIRRAAPTVDATEIIDLLGNIGGIVVKRRHIDFIKDIFRSGFDTGKLTEVLCQSVGFFLPLYNDEELLDIYIEYLDTAGYDYNEVARIMECRNLRLVEYILKDGLSLQCWYDIAVGLRGAPDRDILHLVCRKIEEDPKIGEKACRKIARRMRPSDDLLAMIREEEGTLARIYAEGYYASDSEEEDSDDSEEEEEED